MLSTLNTLLTGSSARAKDGLGSHLAHDIIDQKIREAETQQRAAKSRLALLIQRHRTEQKLLSQLSRRIADLTDRATQALAVNRVDLAHPACAEIARMENERALRPHLKKIVSTCLRCSLEKVDVKADNYCMLLRYVFRSISAGKFEDSYRELLPLIPAVLNGLFRVLSSTDDTTLRHTLIELVLTIPARLSSLLPHMNLLLLVIVLALKSNSDDLVNLG